MSYELVRVTMESDWREYHSLRRHVLWEARHRQTAPAYRVGANNDQCAA
jgi:hypothetical protein